MLKVKSLCKDFGVGTKAVDQVEFDISKGEVLALLGPSGCGKSTLLKMINRLVEPTSGDIFLDEEDYKRSNPIEWRRKIGYVLQRSSLFPHLNVEDNMSLLPRHLKLDSEIIEKRLVELLEKVGLHPQQFRKRYGFQLSGGERQRVAFARSLMLKPKVLLMDEPFAALDPITKKSLIDEVKTLNRDFKTTILFVTHSFVVGKALGDKVALMNKGKIEQIGHAEDLVERPKNDFVRDFISSFGAY